jgi:hypothetical protein
MFNLPKGKLGKRFLFVLSKIIDGVQARNWKSERDLVLCMVILQRGDGKIISAKIIRNNITWRLYAWEKREVSVLVQNAVHSMEAKLSSRQDIRSLDRRAQIFQANMLKGDVRDAVSFLTETEKG